MAELSQAMTAEDVRIHRSVLESRGGQKKEIE